MGNTEWDLANPVQYTYVPAQRQLVRIRAGEQVLLATDVTGVAFADATLDPTLYRNEVKVTLTLQKTTPQRRTVSATAAELVKLRN